jgi:septum formation protein
MSIILASTSPFRKSLLDRLHLPFETYAPSLDETPQLGESPEKLVIRLATLKAYAAQSTYPNALIIGSDQVAVIDNAILGKPITHEQAVKQLTAASGKQVNFLTGLCVLNAKLNRVQTDIIHFSVLFRSLTPSQIENYLRKETPYQCAGSFKSEGLGIALFEKMIGDDPTALIGLPLIRLVRMLEAEGVYSI